MSTLALPERASAVVIGGGIVGCSTAYALARAGWDEVVLVERDQLTSGTTWHSAGFVLHVQPTPGLVGVVRDTMSILRDIEDETGMATGFHQTGQMRLALSEDRMTGLLRQAAVARAQGTRVAHLTPGEAYARFPWFDPEGVVGVVLYPDDGRANPTDTTMALAHGARSERRADQRAHEGHASRGHRRASCRRRDRRGGDRDERGRELHGDVGPTGGGAERRAGAAPGDAALLRRHHRAARLRDLPLRGVGQRRVRLRRIRRARASSSASSSRGAPRGPPTGSRRTRRSRRSPRTGTTSASSTRARRGGSRFSPTPGSVSSSRAQRASPPMASTMSDGRQASTTTGWRRGSTRAGSSPGLASVPTSPGRSRTVPLDAAVGARPTSRTAAPDQRALTSAAPPR